MAQVRSFLRIACSKRLTPASVHGRHVAFMNSTASQAFGAIPEVKPFEDIPGPKGIYNWPLIGSMIHFKPFTTIEPVKCHLLFDALFDKFGPIFKIYLGQRMVMISDPKDIDTVYINEGKYPVRTPITINDVYTRRNNLKRDFFDADGKEWYALRAPLNKKFMKADSAQYYLKPQNIIADEFVKLLTTQKMSPEAMAELFFRFTIESISVVCYNTRLGFLDPKVMNSQETTRQLKALCDLFISFHKSFSDAGHRLFRNKIYRAYEGGRQVIRKQTLQHIKEAQHVLETRKRNGTLDPDEPNLLLYLLSDSSLDFMDIVGIIDVIFIGGTDSTAKNLQTLFYNLAKNPDKQEKLRKEIRNVLGDDEPVTGESLAKLPYLKACLKESFRLLYPTISGTRRQLSTDVVLSGYTVPAGTLITLHNPRSCKQYFSDADKFIPERWIRSSDGHHTEDIPRAALLPFGSGIRTCIGKRFAEQEMYLATIKVLQTMKIGLESDSLNTDFIYTVFVQPEKPLKFTFTAIDE